jgi:hypothetical protein
MVICGCKIIPDAQISLAVGSLASWNALWTGRTTYCQHWLRGLVLCKRQIQPHLSYVTWPSGQNSGLEPLTVIDQSSPHKSLYNLARVSDHYHLTQVETDDETALSARDITRGVTGSYKGMNYCGKSLHTYSHYSAYVLSMGTMLSLVELCMSGLKCLKMAVRVWLIHSARVIQPQPQPHRMKKELGNWFFKTTVKVDGIAEQLNISIGSVCSVVHDNLQFHKVCQVGTWGTDEWA